MSETTSPTCVLGLAEIAYQVPLVETAKQPLTTMVWDDMSAWGFTGHYVT